MGVCGCDCPVGCGCDCLCVCVCVCVCVCDCVREEGSRRMVCVCGMCGVLIMWVGMDLQVCG